MATVTKLLPFKGNLIPYKINITSKKPLYPFSAFNVCLVDDMGNGVLKRLYTKSYDQNESFEFAAPKLDRISHVFVAPENGYVWHMVDMSVITYNILCDNNTCAPKTNTDYFYYNDFIGTSDNPAAIITTNKVPNQLVVQQELDRYDNIKRDIFINTLELNLIGTTIAAYFGSLEKSLAFCVGSAISLVYFKMLEISVDNIGKFDSTKLMSIVGGSIFRLGIIGFLTSEIFIKYHDNMQDGGITLLIGFLGFMIFRLAMLMAFYKNTYKN